MTLVDEVKIHWGEPAGDGHSGDRHSGDRHSDDRHSIIPYSSHWKGIIWRHLPDAACIYLTCTQFRGFAAFFRFFKTCLKFLLPPRALQFSKFNYQCFHRLIHCLGMCRPMRRVSYPKATGDNGLSVFKTFLRRAPELVLCPCYFRCHYYYYNYSSQLTGGRRVRIIGKVRESVSALLVRVGVFILFTEREEG